LRTPPKYPCNFTAREHCQGVRSEEEYPIPPQCSCPQRTGVRAVHISVRICAGRAALHRSTNARAGHEARARDLGDDVRGRHGATARRGPIPRLPETEPEDVDERVRVGDALVQKHPDGRLIEAVYSQLTTAEYQKQDFAKMDADQATAAAFAECSGTYRSVECPKLHRQPATLTGINSLAGGHVPSELRYPIWQGRYLAALLEMNSRRMNARIAAAEDAIRGRLLSSKAEPEERQAILDALHALRFLNR